MATPRRAFVAAAVAAAAAAAALSASSVPMPSLPVAAALAPGFAGRTSGIITSRGSTKLFTTPKSSTALLGRATHDDDVGQETDNSAADLRDLLKDGATERSAAGARRAFLLRSARAITSASAAAAAASAAAVASITAVPPAQAAERAVGSAEIQCRAEGNCLEKGEWDGAIGWEWGARDRCDASDPLCGSDGKLRTEPLRGQPVPQLQGLAVTDVVELTLSIGRNERGTVRMGLYGKDCPRAVQQLVQLCGDAGFSTTSKLLFEEGYGAYSAPVSLSSGGSVPVLYPNQRFDLGLPSQAASYAKSRNLARAGDGFIPQPRPSAMDADALSQEPYVRSHDVAGLISVPRKGIGYGGSGYEPDDEAYASAFQITAASQPAMDKEKRRVIGQLMDEESMATLERVASLPTNKGLKGIVPGQSYGPPLTAVRVVSCAIASTSSASVDSDRGSASAS